MVLEYKVHGHLHNLKSKEQQINITQIDLIIQGFKLSWAIKINTILCPDQGLWDESEKETYSLDDGKGSAKPRPERGPLSTRSRTTVLTEALSKLGSWE